MRALFAFPPVASPTYVPLGLACLCSFVREASFHLLDLNIETWRWLIGRTAGAEGFISFNKGETGDFLVPFAYEASLGTHRLLRQRLSLISDEAARYAQRGGSGRGKGPPSDEAASELHELLELQAEKVLASDPELVGLSVIFPQQLPFALALARRLRQESLGRSRWPKIVLGGADMSAVRVDELMEACPYVDGVHRGEGEAPVAAMVSGRPWSEVEGLTFRTSNGVRKGPPGRTSRMSDLPAPDFSVFDLDRYLNPCRVLPAYFSRACPWRRCLFCSHNYSFGGYRTKTPARFVDELCEYRSAHDARHFYLVDEQLTDSDLVSISREISLRGLDLSFHTMARPTRRFDEKVLASAAEAGFVWVSWGVESGAQRLLDLCGKGTYVPVIERVIRDSYRAGISNLLMMIFGLPTSTDTDLDETLGFMERVYPYIDAVSASVFVLFAHTAFGRNASRYGLIVTGAEEILGPSDHWAQAAHSLRLSYKELGFDGTERPARGSLELGAFNRRRAWLGELPIVNRMCAEHYLIYADSARASRRSLGPGSATRHLHPEAA